MKLNLALSALLPFFASGANPFEQDGVPPTRLIIGYKNENGHGKANGNAQKVHLELGPQNAVAVTMNEPLVTSCVGVPEIAPVAGSRTSPVGSMGLTVQSSTGPQALEARFGTIASPRM